MDDLLVAIRVVLAGVFVVAAVAKVADRPGTRASARSLGVPEGLAGAVPIVLPGAEMALSVALMPVTSAPRAAAGLAALLLAFTLLVAGNLARGRRPTCHCFGALDAAPIGPWTLVRNLVLLAGAAFVAAAGVHPEADVYSGAPWVEVVAGLGLTLLAWGLARRPAPNDPGSATSLVGQPAPQLVLRALDGREVGLLGSLSTTLPTVIVFGKPGCGSCASLLPHIERWQREYADVLKVVLVLAASVDKVATVDGSQEVMPLVLEDEAMLVERFGPVALPSAFVVNPDGNMSTDVLAGPAAIREVVDGLAGREVTSYRPPVETRALVAKRTAGAVGAPMPYFRLPSATGPALTPVDVHAERQVVYVFVEDGSAPCEVLLAELVRRRDLAPHVIVSAGGALGKAAGHLPGPVLVDRLGLLPAAFGVEALPSAVVVADQVVRSGLAVGVEEVLATLSGSEPELIEPSAIEDDFVPRPHPGAATITVDGSTAIADPVNGGFHRLDGPGGVIWAAFDGIQPLHAIAAEISEVAGAPPEVVRRDILDFTRQLGAAGVLHGVRGTDPGPLRT